MHRQERVCYPSYPENMPNFAPLSPNHRGLLHVSSYLMTVTLSFWSSSEHGAPKQIFWGGITSVLAMLPWVNTSSSPTTTPMLEVSMATFDAMLMPKVKGATSDAMLMPGVNRMASKVMPLLEDKLVTSDAMPMSSATPKPDTDATVPL